MREIIIKHLNELEQKENIKILFAIESGSRAWGFASPDSDYDVRFVYKRWVSEYLRLEKHPDVIEYILTDELDINGWDLYKALKLLHSSNPTLFEWCNSPIVYKSTPFFDELNKIKNDYFLSKAGLCHYLSMAGGNYREYLKGEEVKLKKYFYVLRPLFACEWILKNNTPPPMPFGDLLFLLPQNLRPIIDKLLNIKMNNPEITFGKKIMELNDWIEYKLEKLAPEISKLPSGKKPDWEGLNKLFLTEMEF